MALSIRQGYVPGAIGRITELHGAYYARHAGFGVYFESKVARELAEFCARFEQGRDGLWLAVAEDSIEAAIAIDASHADQDGAHLRWFIASDRIRGTGTGGALIESAVAFCRARAYPRVYLWTFEGLGAARHLYEKVGFRLAEQRRGAQWGREVNEQRFELRL